MTNRVENKKNIAGRIEAIKKGRVWYTTRKAVEAYRGSVERG